MPPTGTVLCGFFLPSKQITLHSHAAGGRSWDAYYVHGHYASQRYLQPAVSSGVKKHAGDLSVRGDQRWRACPVRTGETPDRRGVTDSVDVTQLGQVALKFRAESFN